METLSRQWDTPDFGVLEAGGYTWGCGVRVLGVNLISETRE